jgi:hypothetical protein
MAVAAYALAGDLSATCRRTSLSGGPVEGPFPWEEELALQEAVVEAILAGPQPAPLGFLDGLEVSLETLWEKRRSAKAGERPAGGVEVSSPGGGKSGNHEGGGVTGRTQKVGMSGSQEGGKETEGGWEDSHDGWDADWDADENEQASDAVGAPGDEAAYDEVRLRLEVKDRVEELFGKLRLISTARQKLHGFQYLDQGSRGLGATCTGLLRQLVARICAREEVPGLEHASSAVKKLLQTGLGKFGFQNFQSSPKPGEQKVVLVFVVGGITLGEVGI